MPTTDVLKMRVYPAKTSLCHPHPSHALVREHIRPAPRLRDRRRFNGQMIRSTTMITTSADVDPLSRHSKAAPCTTCRLWSGGDCFSAGVQARRHLHGLRLRHHFLQVRGASRLQRSPFKVLMTYRPVPCVGVMSSAHASRLGRPLVVLAGPGDRRDEDLARSRRLSPASSILHRAPRRFAARAARRRRPRIIAKALRDSGVAKSDPIIPTANR